MVIDATVKRSKMPPRLEWLTELQNDLALSSTQEAKRIWPGAAPQFAPYYNDRLEKVQQVERDAFRLLETIPADREVLSAAVWLHCRFTTKADSCASQGAQWARENLASLGFPSEKVEQVAYAVEHYNDPPCTIPEDEVDARLLWDAVHLSDLGTLQVVSDLLARPAHPEHKVTFTGFALLGLEKLNAARKMTAELYFPESQAIAQERYEQQKAFYQAFAQAVEA